MRPLLLLLALAAGSAAAQPAASPSPAPAPAAASDWRDLDPDNTLVIDTTKGRVIVEMRPEMAPLAVARIKTLARKGYYDQALFYRVLKDYMAQTGDKGARTFRSDLPNLKAEFTFTNSPSSGFVSIGDIPGAELGFIGSMPVTVQKDGKAWGMFCPGVGAMPHYDNPDTANSQLFFMRTWSPNLDKTFTTWGRIVSGQEAIKAVANGEPPPAPDKMVRVRVMADMPAADRPKLRLIDPRGQTFAALLRKEVADKGAAFNICWLELPTQAQ